MANPLIQVFDLNYEVLTSNVYHTRARDLNIEYMGEIPYHTRVYDVSVDLITDITYHTRVSDMFIEVIAAAPELSPQPPQPYFSLYFQT